jgi:probable HAF family extracellular repeat protein
VTPGTGFNEHGFLWTEDAGMQDLGTLEGDVRSQAWGINERGQVVGLSRGAGGDRAVLWQDGAIIDLNDRLAFDYDKHLLYANDVNDLGMITGQAVDPDSEEGVAFLAIPVPTHGQGSGD